MVNLIGIIRISGIVKMEKKHAEETMKRLRLKKKYTCVLIDERPEMLGMLDVVKNFVAYGTIDEKTLVELLKHRGKKIGNVKAKLTEAEANKIAKEVMAGKSLEECGIVPWFGMHPARGGLDTKHHVPKGVLGNHKDKLNELIARML